ncbi:MAG: undecaprenyl/decaprenyl-phosphate alpha-N-acetylglucosaminyl 1-phosphate transferase [Sulfuritalea sp.]|nr:undecaprenyl/decaprenyl-phosphate alpha-N-acetylglucosaminyl 1-phosphate transferase [Sulfuritalea sp.]
MTESFSSWQTAVLILVPLLSAGLIRLLMFLAPAWGLIDHPGHRKVHQHATPLVGGLGMLMTLLLAQVACGFEPFESSSLLVALAVVTVIGVADDAHELSHRAKFVAQAIGAGIIVSGTSIWVTGLGDLIGVGDIELGKWAILVTIISVVGVMNAVNMIDGLDGLAGSVSMMSVLVLALLALDGGQVNMGFELLLLAAAIAGFLFLNLRLPGRARALVFMGDTGGMIIGMLIAWYSIKLGGSSNAQIKPITAVWVLGMPLLDMGSVMLVRLMQRKSPFHADQQHLHHVLLHAGYSVNQVVGIMSFVALALGAFAVGAERSGVAQATMFLSFIVVWAAYVLALKNPPVTQALARRIILPASKRADFSSS